MNIVIGMGKEVFLTILAVASFSLYNGLENATNVRLEYTWSPLHSMFMHILPHAFMNHPGSYAFLPPTSHAILGCSPLLLVSVANWNLITSQFHARYV